MIKSLTHPSDENDVAFHVIAPSIPGFGFSPAPIEPGFGYIEAAHAFHQLMQRLGYEKYLIQGGDAGGLIMRYQASFYSSVIAGLNNFWVISPSSADLQAYNSGKSSGDEEYVIKGLQSFIDNRWGYGQIQQTRPLRLAYALTDSPIGLAMWIYDALWPSVENTGIWTAKEIITWTMMHWIQGPYGGLRIYKEGALVSQSVDTKTGRWNGF